MTKMAAGYARALFELSREENLSDEILEQLNVLEAAFSAEPEFLRLLANPGIAKAERCGMLDESFRGRVHLYVLNLLKLLTENGDILTFHDCVKQFRAYYNEANGILCVLAVSAVALTQEQAQKLQQKLETVTGKKIRLETKIDPACLGGLRLDYDGKRIDGTVKNRLEAMALQLNQATL